MLNKKSKQSNIHQTSSTVTNDKLMIQSQSKIIAHYQQANELAVSNINKAITV